MLCYRKGNAGDVDFLESVFTQKRGAHVTGNSHHRNRIHVSSRNSSDQIRRSRTGSGHADTDPTRGAGIAVCCMSGRLFMGSKDMINSA